MGYLEPPEVPEGSPYPNEASGFWDLSSADIAEEYLRFHLNTSCRHGGTGGSCYTSSWLG